MQNHAKNQSIKRIAPVAAVAFVAAMLVGAFSFTTAAYAFEFDPATGTGFVGKGEVQTALGMNNAEIQRQASNVQFQAKTTQETTWLCEHTTNPNAADVERSITTTTEGVVSNVAREGPRGQVTGFNLNGYSGDPIVTTDPENREVGFCQGSNRQLQEGSIEEGDAVTTLQVRLSGGDWVTL